MTHYLVLLIVDPASMNTLAEHIREVMEPYSLHREVEPYTIPCPCTDDGKAPDEKCLICGGRGVLESTTNPNAKHDWYRVGGNFDGLIQGELRRGSDYGLYVGPHHEKLEFNTQPVAELPKDLPIHAVITPHGLWYEGEDALLRLTESQDCTAVAVDIHIVES